MPQVSKEAAKSRRSFVPRDFVITDWESLAPWYDQLLEMPLNSKEDLLKFMDRQCELDAIVREDMAWRYIRMTCDTQSEENLEAYNHFISNILPHLSAISNKLDRKLVASPALDQLDKDKYHIPIRQKKNDIALFREENIPLGTEITKVAQQFDQISGNMTIEENGQELTLQQAAAKLESHDRELRERVWTKIVEKRAEHIEELNKIFSELVSLRHQMAKNADFETYTQYKFLELGRFDYSQQDCDNFHDSISEVIKPVYLKELEIRREKLGLEKLRPWDLAVDLWGDEPLRPFTNERELIEKTISIISRLRPDLGDMIRTMDKMGHLDLGSRKGKAPGGYNYPLAETGIPFIFMNAVGTQSDLTTMLHEAGHAVHAFLTKDLELLEFREVPSEGAELASMAMELITMDFWDEVYENAEDLKRARRDQILRTITLLPWVATIDHFQKWAYNHPEHTEEERKENWLRIHERYQGTTIDWSGFEFSLSTMWQRQGHIFDVPFYYIEYGMAQLGAIAVWRNYKQDPEKGLQQYLDALSLGYTKTLPEIYEAAGIKFDFSSDYIRELSDFVMGEWEKTN